MRKLTARQLARLLAARQAPQPPPDLAASIKREIPEFLTVGGTVLENASLPGMPPRESAYRPFLLIAASVLVVVGVGFVAARLLQPPTNLAREIALGGVTVIDDIAMTVPLRAAVEPETQQVEAATRAAETTETAPNRPVAAAEQVEAVTVVVRRADGSPYPGAVVKLESGGSRRGWRRVATTDGNGVAFFLGVPVGTYTLSAGFTDSRPATIEMLRVTKKTVTRVDLRVTHPQGA